MMAALIFLGGIGYVLLGVYASDPLMFACGSVIMIFFAVMEYTKRRARKATARSKADLIARFAAKQEASTKGDASE